jgi:hypothetical protein
LTLPISHIKALNLKTPKDRLGFVKIAFIVGQIPLRFFGLSKLEEWTIRKIVELISTRTTWVSLLVPLELYVLLYHLVPPFVMVFIATALLAWLRNLTAFRDPLLRILFPQAFNNERQEKEMLQILSCVPARERFLHLRRFSLAWGFEVGPIVEREMKAHLEDRRLGLSEDIRQEEVAYQARLTYIRNERRQQIRLEACY